MSRWIVFIVLAVLTVSCSERAPKEIFRIARDPTWYPLNLYSRESAMLGFIDELIFAVAKEQELKVELVFTSSNSLLIGLNKNIFDGVVTSILPNELSNRYYLFSEPLYLLGFVLVIPIESDVESIQQLQEKIIGIERGSAAAFDTIRYPTVNIRPYENINNALENLSRNEIDAVLMPAIPASIYTQGIYSDRLKIVTKPLTNSGLRLLLKNEKIDQTFVSLFNEGLETLKENGFYDQLCLKWGLYNPESVEEDPADLPLESSESL